MSNLQSTALVDACYFGGKIIGIVCSIIETLGQERGWGDICIVGRADLHECSEGGGNRMTALQHYLIMDPPLQLFLADGGRCDTWWRK